MENFLEKIIYCVGIPLLLFVAILLGGTDNRFDAYGDKLMIGLAIIGLVLIGVLIAARLVGIRKEKQWRE